MSAPPLPGGKPITLAQAKQVHGLAVAAGVTQDDVRVGVTAAANAGVVPGWASKTDPADTDRASLKKQVVVCVRVKISL